MGGVDEAELLGVDGRVVAVLGEGQRRVPVLARVRLVRVVKLHLLLFH